MSWFNKKLPMFQIIFFCLVYKNLLHRSASTKLKTTVARRKWKSSQQRKQHTSHTNKRI